MPAQKCNWQYGVFSIIYLIIGVLSIGLCYVWQPAWKIAFLPAEVGSEDTRQLVWCLGWNSLGLSMAALSIAVDGKDHRSALPRYVSLYPVSLIVISFLVFGLLRVFVAKASAPLFFYALSAAPLMYLGFRIDRALDFNPIAMMKSCLKQK